MIEHTPHQQKHTTWFHRPMADSDVPRYGFVGYTATAAAVLSRQVGVRLVITDDQTDPRQMVRWRDGLRATRPTVGVRLVGPLAGGQRFSLPGWPARRNGTSHRPDPVRSEQHDRGRRPQQSRRR